MEQQKKQAAFTLRLSAEADAKLAKLAKGQRRSKTTMIEVLIMDAKHDDTSSSS